MGYKIWWSVWLMRNYWEQDNFVPQKWSPNTFSLWMKMTASLSDIYGHCESERKLLLGSRDPDYSNEVYRCVLGYCFDESIESWYESWGQAVSKSWCTLSYNFIIMNKTPNASTCQSLTYLLVTLCVTNFFFWESLYVSANATVFIFYS